MAGSYSHTRKISESMPASDQISGRPRLLFIGLHAALIISFGTAFMSPEPPTQE